MAHYPDYRLVTIIVHLITSLYSATELVPTTAEVVGQLSMALGGTALTATASSI